MQGQHQIKTTLGLPPILGLSHWQHRLLPAGAQHHVLLQGLVRLVLITDKLSEPRPRTSVVTISTVADAAPYNWVPT